MICITLLTQSYAAWSEQTLALLRQAPRDGASERFLAFVSTLRPGDRVNEEISRQGHRLYKAALDACQTRFGLRYLQPGRFLCPGPRGDVPLLWFFPMDIRAPLVLPRDSLMALLDERFEAYKRDIRASFFDTHFRSFDRQVVLVDVLGALYAGQAAFEDTARALADIAGQLRYGANALVDAPDGGDSPLALLRERRDLELLRLLVSLYHAQHLRDYGGIDWRQIRIGFERVMVADSEGRVILGFRIGPESASNDFLGPFLMTSEASWWRKASVRMIMQARSTCCLVSSICSVRLACWNWCRI